jgi:hypothetical protein
MLNKALNISKYMINDLGYFQYFHPNRIPHTIHFEKSLSQLDLKKYTFPISYMQNLYVKIIFKPRRLQKFRNPVLFNVKIFFKTLKRKPLNISKRRKHDLGHYHNHGHIYWTKK